MIFTKKSQIEKNLGFFLHLIFHVITAPETLKSNRNIQDFALIRAILFSFPV